MTPLEKELLEALKVARMWTGIIATLYPGHVRDRGNVKDDIAAIDIAIAHATAQQPAPAIDIARAGIADMEQPRNCNTCCWDGRGTANCDTCGINYPSWTPRTVTLNPSDVAAMADKLGQVL